MYHTDDDKASFRRSRHRNRDYRLDMVIAVQGTLKYSGRVKGAATEREDAQDLRAGGTSGIGGRNLAEKTQTRHK